MLYSALLFVMALRLSGVLDLQVGQLVVLTVSVAVIDGLTRLTGRLFAWVVRLCEEGWDRWRSR